YDISYSQTYLPFTPFDEHSKRVLRSHFLDIFLMDKFRRSQKRKMAMLSEKVKHQVKETLKDLKDTVKLVVFTQEFECPSCGDNRVLMEELSSISDKVSVEVLDFVRWR
ncbi:hypothetical protein C5S53_01285, partial [Methanophagales archaeon]